MRRNPLLLLLVTILLTMPALSDTIIRASLSKAMADALYVNVSGDTMTGSLLGKAGTCASVSFGFTGEADTGLILSAANATGICTGGTERWVFNASGALNPATNNTNDIGNGSVNPRDIHVARNFLLYGSTSGKVTFAAAATTTDYTFTWPSAVAGSPTTMFLRGDGSWATAGAANPFDDGTALVKGSADATKLLRFEVDGFTTGTTRVATPPNADFTMARIDAAQTFTGTQTFSGSIVGSGTANRIGTATTADATVDTLVASSGVGRTAFAIQGAASPTGGIHQFRVGPSAWTAGIGFMVNSDFGVIIRPATGATYSQFLRVTDNSGTTKFDVVNAGIDVYGNVVTQAVGNGVNIGAGRALLYGAAIGVLTVGSTANGTDGWVRSGGTCVVASDQTNATTTPQTAACYETTSGTVAIALKAGRTYTGKCVFFLNDSVAADGASIDFDAGTATATTFRAHTTGFDSALAKSEASTTLANDVDAATFTGDGYFETHLYFKVNAAGTFQPRFFQNAHTTGTLTLYEGSHCTLVDATP